MQTTPTNIMQTADNSWHRRQTLHSKRQQAITASPINQSINQSINQPRPFNKSPGKQHAHNDSLPVTIQGLPIIT